MSTAEPYEFEVLANALAEAWDPTEVQDDVDGEREAGEQWGLLVTPGSPGNVDECNDGTDPSQPSDLEAVLETASRVINDATHNDYKRLTMQFDEWIKKQKLVGPDHAVFGDSIPEKMPTYICVWIMSKCDSLKPLGGQRKPGEIRGSYSLAMKMRAALTFGFSQSKKRGINEWYEDERGQWQGNPSVSTQVSRYMISLRRRKVHGGEVAMSSRAITPAILRQLYDFNTQHRQWVIKPYAPRSHTNNDINDWCGGRVRRLLQCVYLLAFWCLLRFDEVLKIQAHDVTYVTQTCIKLTLPYRKTHQNGAVKPYYLHLLPDHHAHLCPVRAFAEWYGDNHQQLQHGFIFRRIVSGDRISDANAPMSQEECLEMFRNNLLDVGLDPFPYGTHSFRRGGCQWLASGCRWPLRRICDWGGWSLNLTSLTIVKYLISWNDDPQEPREEYLNFNRDPAVKCFACGRSCHCS